MTHPIFAIIQARMSSSRLPGKVLMDIAGKPMLGRVIERAARTAVLDGVAVATTSEPEDEPVAALCAEMSVPVYRGSLHDVLDRYYQAAKAFGAQTIVRLTADCPLIDPGEIDHVVSEFLAQRADFAANRLPWGRTVPVGLDTEVCSFAALERAWKEAAQPYEREHVMPYLYDQEGRFRVLLVNSSPSRSDLRWTVDTQADLDLLRAVYARFPGRGDFSYAETLALFEREPELAEINSGVKHKTFKDVDSRRFENRG